MIAQEDFAEAISKIISSWNPTPIKPWPTVADVNDTLNVISKYRFSEPKALASVDCHERQRISKIYFSKLKALASA